MTDFKNYEPFTPIKMIAYDAINSGDPKKHERALRDILFFIRKEEEGFRLRIDYYNQLLGK